MKHRLQKLLAQANLGSRRATEDFITAGRVMVNGEVAILGTKADRAVQKHRKEVEANDMIGFILFLIVVGLVRFIVSTTLFGILLLIAIYALDPGDKMTMLLALAWGVWMGWRGFRVRERATARGAGAAMAEAT